MCALPLLLFIFLFGSLFFRSCAVLVLSFTEGCLFRLNLFSSYCTNTDIYVYIHIIWPNVEKLKLNFDFARDARNLVDDAKSKSS